MRVVAEASERVFVLSATTMAPTVQEADVAACRMLGTPARDVGTGWVQA